jgi:metal-dependent amidase/aminoacylase/carboxypeptidase family protein
MVEMYKDLHQHPELAFSAQYRGIVAKELKALL